jgi:hypothetical protein
MCLSWLNLLESVNVATIPNTCSILIYFHYQFFMMSSNELKAMRNCLESFLADIAVLILPIIIIKKAWNP